MEDIQLSLENLPPSTPSTFDLLDLEVPDRPKFGQRVELQTDLSDNEPPKIYRSPNTWQVCSGRG